MALQLPTNLAAGNVNAPAGSYGAVTTPTFTPAAGARIFVAALVARAATAVASLSISDSIGLEWELVGQDGFSPPAGGVSTAAVWTAIATGAAMTVTVTPSISGQLLFQIHPYQITADEGTPLLVQHDVQRTTAGGTWSVAFPDGAPAAGNVALGWLFAGPQNGGISPAAGSGFTELYEGVSGSQSTGQAQYRMSGAGASIGWTGLTTTAATKYGFVVELEEPSPAQEEHEGAAAISGGGSPESAGAKEALGVAAASTGGEPQASGVKVAAGIAGVTAAGATATGGSKRAAGGAALSGGGAVDATGTPSEGASGAAHVVGGGELAAAGVKRGAGAGQLAGGGSVQTWAAKSITGQVLVSGGGAVVSRGSSEEREQHAGAAQVSGGGGLQAMGAKDGAGSVSLISGGAAQLAGEKLARAAARVAGGGTVAAFSTRIARGALYLAGGGRIRARGANPETQPVPPYAAALSVSSRPASLTVVTLAAALSVSTRPAGLTVEDA